MNRPAGNGVGEKGSAFLVVALLAITSTALAGAHLSSAPPEDRNGDGVRADGCEHIDIHLPREHDCRLLSWSEGGL